MVEVSDAELKKIKSCFEIPEISVESLLKYFD